MMIGKLFKSIWKIIDVILYLAACVCFTYGAFLFNQIAGFIVLGLVLLISAYLTELVPKKGSDN
ncbi:DUF1056 family protein [Lactobacillus panisapium]|uniref:DUF1056 family protein n=1 Tax=Lactobacillus panisapium TaxID=2012495 RepID=A0ABX8W5M2_9LACO|nr:DUF1056 family protein [Lactobacillus panisapium]QYN53065.1 DUF1056 family protein [Lactobacillus panisapium]